MRRAILTIAVCLTALPAFAARLPLTILTQDGERHYTVEVASTDAEREEGLMNRERMGKTDGMIFLFPQQSDYHFWMKNTRIPLDMLFLDAAHTVVHIETAQPQTLDLHQAGQPVAAVIELDGGRARREGIAVGDSVNYVIPSDIRIR